MNQDPKPQESVGGQAIIEGVMMRTPAGVAIAVRDPRGGIVVRDRPWRSWTKRFRPLGWPFIRGVVVLVESLKEGIDGLRFSAEAAVEEEGASGSSSSAKWTANLAMVLGFALAIVLFKGIPHTASVALGFVETQPLFHVVDGLVKLLLVVGYITAISRMKDIQRVFQYHGAEHKSIRTYEQRADLTADEAKQFSRLHERCGTSFIIVVVISSVFVYMGASFAIPADLEISWLIRIGLVFIKILLLGPVAAIAYEINRMAGKHWQHPLARVVAAPGLLMQKLLTTREPSPDQLEVALVSLRAALAASTGAGESTAAATVPWRTRRFDSFDAFVESLGTEPEPKRDQSEAA